MSDEQIVNTTEDIEEKELQELSNRFTKAPRFAKWRELYFDKNNSETFGNATECTLIAYKLDRTSASDRHYASEVGRRNRKKCETWAQDYLSAKGLTPEKTLDILAEKSIKTNNARYLQMLMEITDTYQPQPSTLVQNNTQTNIQIHDSEAKDFSAAFKRFLEQE